MENTTRVALFLGLLILSHTATPQASLSLTTEQRDNISARYSMCSAYFNVVRAGMNKSGYSELADKHRDVALAAVKQSFELASTNRTPEMTQRVVEARYSINRDRMLEEIDNDFSNISILTNKYQQECALASTNQREFIRKYLESNK